MEDRLQFVRTQTIVPHTIDEKGTKLYSAEQVAEFIRRYNFDNHKS